MFLGVESLKIVHPPKKLTYPTYIPWKLMVGVESIHFQIWNALLFGGRIERSGLVKWWPSTGAILLWHKITFDPVQVDVQRRGASALNHGLWPLDLCTEKKIWIFGDFWDLVFNYYLFSNLPSWWIQRTAEPLKRDGCGVFRGADYSHLLCFLTAEILPNATSTLGTRHGRAAFNAKCLLPDLLPRGERQATHHHGLAPLWLTEWTR